MGSQEQGVNMTPLVKIQTSSSVILILFVTGGLSDLQQGQRVPSYENAPVGGGFVSPSKDYDDLLTKLENYEKPALPHVAPIEDVYNHLGDSAYDRYSIEKQDNVEDEDANNEDYDDDDDELKDDDDNTASNNYYFYDIIVPSVAIGLAALLFSLTFGIGGNGRSDDSFFSFLPKPQVTNNIVVDDLLAQVDNALGRFKRAIPVTEDTDYVAYLLNSVEVLTNINGGVQSASCELGSLARDSRFPTLARIISPFLGKNVPSSNCS